jgi:cytochrome c biogenesis protein CcdA
MRRVIRLIGIAISIGIADSLNPSTIGPALFLAGGEHPRAKVSEFTFGVFAVYLIGGAAIALGPGQLLLDLVPHPRREVRHIIEISAGVAMLVAAAVLWRFRESLSKREIKTPATEGRSAALIGATIMAVELPTAFPYFAAIAAIVGSGFDPLRQLFLLVVFNIAFVLPLIGILATLAFAGDRAVQMLTTSRQWLEKHWPALLATVALLAGIFVVLLGVTGIAGPRSRLARLLRHVPGFPKHP